MLAAGRQQEVVSQAVDAAGVVGEVVDPAVVVPNPLAVLVRPLVGDTTIILNKFSVMLLQPVSYKSNIKGIFGVTIVFYF